VFFLTRGYGGSVAEPRRVAPTDDAKRVGDEALLLSKLAPTIVSRDRAEGAALAAAQGADVIVMDDGHQNFVLTKDLSIVVVDAETGFANGRVLPAGPLREPVSQGLARADAVILVGEGIPALGKFARPVLSATIKPADMRELDGQKLVAFAGIGRPEKFFQSLRKLGAVIEHAKSYADHHIYTASDVARLRSKARASGARLITTEKDFVRLTALEREGISFLPVHAEFTEPAKASELLDRVASKAIPPGSA
jgi:tetraacyldisaccharide 4'-kinase